MTFLYAINGWHWLVFALIFLATRWFGLGGNLVGVAAAAALVAILMALAPVEWAFQWVVFVLAGVLFSAVYWRYFRPPLAPNETSKLTKRVARLVGMRASLMEASKGGRAKVQIQDALWAVTCDKDLPAGTMVEVTGYEGSVLNVSKI